MDFTLSPDEIALRDAVREFCARRYDDGALVEGRAADAALWADLAGLGIFALRLDEADDGAGLDHAAAVIAFEELGRALVPGPLVASHVAAGLVDGAATGETPVGWLDTTREPLLVEHPDFVGQLLVDAGAEIHLIARSAISGDTAAAPVDPVTPVLRLSATPTGGDVVGESAALRRLGALLTAAYQTGIAASVTERSVAYVKEREQFGRPVGSFQAVKHLLADMLVRVELARAAVHAAAVTVDDPEVGDPDRAVAGAKLLADEAALLDTKAAIQAHGGMGFTWEMPLHRYLKRAWLLSTTFGTADTYAEALAASA
jgi:alkylation response protein AidB-like acyl-CoA dehydrogenase